MKSVNSPQSLCRAVAGQVDITPPIGIYHRMWGAAKHDRAASVHRPLVGTMLWLVPRNDDRSQSSVIIALDHCILDFEDIAQIQASVAKSLSINAEQVIVCLSHTHAAGLMSRTRSRLPGGDRIGPYLDQLSVKLGELACAIQSQLEDATIVYGRGRCDLAAERDYWDVDQKKYVCGFNPTGNADDTLMVAQVVNSSGKCLATIVNYACHPTTLAWDNQAISPDYVGAMREVVQTHTSAPCLFLQGASGDLGPREGFVGDTGIADRNGRKLGYAALSILESLPAPGTRYDYAGAVVSGTLIGTWKAVPESDAQLRELEFWHSTEVVAELPYRHDLPSIDETRAQLTHWNELERQAATNGEVERQAYCRAMGEQMERQIWRQATLPQGKCFPLKVSMLHCGTGRWLLVPGEHYQILQTTLRKRFPNEAWMIATICNGWQPGYVPPASKYGYGIYQEQIAIVAAGSAEIVIESVSRAAM